MLIIISKDQNKQTYCSVFKVHGFRQEIYPYRGLKMGNKLLNMHHNIPLALDCRITWILSAVIKSGGGVWLTW